MLRQLIAETPSFAGASFPHMALFRHAPSNLPGLRGDAQERCMERMAPSHLIASTTVTIVFPTHSASWEQATRYFVIDFVSVHRGSLSTSIWREPPRLLDPVPKGTGALSKLVEPRRFDASTSINLVPQRNLVNASLARDIPKAEAIPRFRSWIGDPAACIENRDEDGSAPSAIPPLPLGHASDVRRTVGL